MANWQCRSSSGGLASDGTEANPFSFSGRFVWNNSTYKAFSSAPVHDTVVTEFGSDCLTPVQHDHASGFVLQAQVCPVAEKSREAPVEKIEIREVRL